ncbi:MAG: Do family serine endopeptidase [Verrucomicrobiales bacterium]|nr:Do family serine endopeptidase [Verrucomicrobiales bacterium]
MKVIDNRIKKLGAGAMVLLLAAASTVQAKDVKYDELSKHLTFDKTPLAKQAGVVTSYADVIEKVTSSVVTIFSSKEVKQKNQPRSQMFDDPRFRKFFGLPDDFEMPKQHKQEGLGSGIIITSDGYILTNNHVVGGKGTKVKVTLAGTKKDYEARVVGADPQTDVALIKIEATGLKAATIGDSSKLRVGDVMLAIGNPFSLEQSVTMGIVSALGRSNLGITGGGYENFIQTDASINQGNSGGALMDAQGRLVGINTAIRPGMGGGNIGIGFSIPVNMALGIVEKLLDSGGNVPRGFLGVTLKDIDADMAKALGRDNRNGVMVSEVWPGTPAEKSGFRPGDLILAYQGAAVNSMAKLRLAISNTAPGKKVGFELLRNGKTEKKNVELGDLGGRGKKLAAATPEVKKPVVKVKTEQLAEGVMIRDLDPEMTKALGFAADVSGVLVESVKENSPAGESGLRAGQVITQINQVAVPKVADALKQLKGFNGEVLLLQVYEQGRRDIIAVRIK